MAEEISKAVPLYRPDSCGDKLLARLESVANRAEGLSLLARERLAGVRFDNPMPKSPESAPSTEPHLFARSNERLDRISAALEDVFSVLDGTAL